MTTKYRVTLRDTVDGKVFYFAISVNAKGLLMAEKLVNSEFPDANIFRIEDKDKKDHLKDHIEISEFYETN